MAVTEIDLITKDEGVLTASRDALIQQRSNPDGILVGFDGDAISYSENKVTFVSGGVLCICGRIVNIASGTEVSLEDGETFIKVSIYKKQVNDAPALVAELSGASISEGETFPTLLKDDINYSAPNGTYEALIGKVDANNNSNTKIIIPRVTFGGIYYGTEEIDVFKETYPFQEGSVYFQIVASTT